MGLGVGTVETRTGDSVGLEAGDSVGFEVVGALVGIGVGLEVTGDLVGAVVAGDRVVRYVVTTATQKLTQIHQKSRNHRSCEITVRLYLCVRRV